jgi:hypothetical protein
MRYRYSGHGDTLRKLLLSPSVALPNARYALTYHLLHGFLPDKIKFNTN